MAGDINTEDRFSYPNTDISATKPIATHIHTCDELWEQAGKLAHQAFTTFSRPSKPRRGAKEPVTQSQPAAGPDLPTPTLKEWIAENVIFV